MSIPVQVDHQTLVSLGSFIRDAKSLLRWVAFIIYKQNFWHNPNLICSLALDLNKIKCIVSNFSPLKLFLIHFQQKDLKRVFVFCLQVLHELEKVPSPLERDVTTVFNRFLSITEQILSWEFLPKHHILSHKNVSIIFQNRELWDQFFAVFNVWI